MSNKRTTALILILMMAIFSFASFAQVEDGRGPGGGGKAQAGGGTCDGTGNDGNGGNGNGNNDGDKGNGAGDGTGPLYFDTATITTLNGTLTAENTDWEVQGSGNCTGTGMHFTFSSGGTSYELILGPYTFLSENGLSLSTGDSVKVTGSVVDPYLTGFTNQFLIATSITAGGITVDLRDEAGFPLWRGAQFGGANGQGVGRGPNGEFYFDVDNVQTLNGTLAESLNYWTACGAGNTTGSGMHYVFESDSGTRYYLMAGPYWFMDDNDFNLELGQEVTITGSVVDAYNEDMDEYQYIIAVSIDNGDDSIDLRDSEGYPLWTSGNYGDYNCPNFDRDSETTITATVSSVRYRSNGDNVDTGMELIVTTNGDEYRVYMAPAYFCEDINVNIDRGDAIRVTGSLDDDEIVARKIINSSGKTFRFRLTDGTPLWQQ